MMTHEQKIAVIGDLRTSASGGRLRDLEQFLRDMIADKMDNLVYLTDEQYIYRTQGEILALRELLETIFCPRNEDVIPGIS